MIEPIYHGETAIIVGTGPSLTPEVIQTAAKAQKEGKVRLFGMNMAFSVLDLDLLHGCNIAFWDHYWPEVKDLRCHKWTTRPELKGKYSGLNYIQERWEDCLSTDPSYITAHHGSSAQAMGLAYHYGIKTMLLVGFDMRFPGKVNRHHYNESRHFHDETPLTSQHWPMTGPNGELDGLIREFVTINPERLGIEIINCTPGSAMTCFPMMDLDKALEMYA